MEEVVAMVGGIDACQKLDGGVQGKILSCTTGIQPSYYNTRQISCSS
jgi:hypothetical protein